MQTSLELYQKILTEEFIRELQFLLDVNSGRAQEKADFTDKLLSSIKSKATDAIKELPGGEWLAKALEYAIDWGNELRKEGKRGHASQQGHQVELQHLRIVLDTVAMEAARRHQFFITEYLSESPLEGVVPFAKTGVERMLGYVLRNKMNLHEEHLLNGLMKGKSGKYISGYSNTSLKMREELNHKKRVKRWIGLGKYTAEGAYARSGLIDLSGRLYKQSETKFIDNRENSKDPKYGYTLLPIATIKSEVAKKDKAAIIQPKEVISEHLQSSLANHYPSWVTITKKDLSDYLEAIDANSPDNESLLSFMTKQLAYPHGKSIDRLFYAGEKARNGKWEEEKGDWDLTVFNFSGADLSDTVLNHCVFSGTLDRTQFNRSYLRQADFSQASSAKQSSYKSAQLGFLQAQGVDFSGSDFTQAHGEYAEFQNANFKQCQILGMTWAYANLEAIKLDKPADLDAIKQAQGEQVEAMQTLSLQVNRQQAQIEQLQANLKQLSEAIKQSLKSNDEADKKRENAPESSDSEGEDSLSSNVTNAFKALKEESEVMEGGDGVGEKANTLRALQAINSKFIQDQQSRLAFDRYCKSKLSELRSHSNAIEDTQNTQKTQIEALEERIQTLQSQDKVFEKLAETLCHQLKTTNEQIVSNTLDVANLKYQIEKSEKLIQSTLDKQSQALAKLSERVNELESDVSEIKQDIASMEARLDIKDLPKEQKKLEITSKKVTQTIKARYESDNTIEGVFGKPLSMSEQGGYVNLQMIFSGRIEKKREQEQEKTRSSQKDKNDGDKDDSKNGKPDKTVRDERLSSFEDLFGEKKVLALGDAFKPAKDVLKTNEKEMLRLDNEDSNVAPNLLFIQGRAGIGKTTCVRYSANQWAVGKLWPDIEWLFVLTFRGLRTFGFVNAQAQGKQLPLWEWVYRHNAFNQGQGKTKVSSFQVQRIKKPAFEIFWDNLIETQSSKVAFILDGLDEAPAEHPCQGALYNLLNDKSYQACKVMITSRPGSENILPNRRRDLEVVGLTNENIEKYITRFFEKSETEENRQASDGANPSTQLVISLKAQPTLWGMAHIPVTLNLMCGLFEEGDANFEHLHSMSGLYSQMESKLFILAAKRLAPTLKSRAEKSIKDVIKSTHEKYAKDYYQLHRQILGQMALRGLQAEKIILPLEWLEEAISEVIASKALSSENSQQFKDECLHLGLLKYTINNEESEKASGDLEFIHLTFQEYYGAVQIASDLQSRKAKTLAKAKRFVDESLLNPRYQVLFWLVMGLLKENPQALSTFFERFIDEKNLSRDLIGEYRLGLLARGIEEIMLTTPSSEKKINDSRLLGIEKQFQKKLFDALLDRINGWFKAYELNGLWYEDDMWDAEIFFISPVKPEESFLIQMLGLSPNVSSLLSLMSGNQLANKQKSELATEFIGETGLSIPPSILKALEVKLANKNGQVREAALKTVGNLGPSATTPAILTNILKLLGDEESNVCEAAFYAVGELGSSAATPAILNAVLRMLSDEDSNVREVALKAVGSLGASAAIFPILTSILKLLGDENKWVYRAALEAVGKLGASASTPAFLEEILRGLNDESHDVREAALKTVGRLEASAVTPAFLDSILTGLGDKYQNVRKAALDAVCNLGSSATSPTILNGVLKLLGDERRYLRKAAFDAVDWLRSSVATPAFLEGILRLLQDKRGYLRKAALYTVSKLGSSAATPAILDAVLRLLGDEDLGVRISTLYTVRMLGSSAATPPILARIWRLLGDENSNVYREALKTVGKLGPSAATPAILSCLEKWLGDEVEDIRKAAVEAVGNLGASAATPAILEGVLNLLDDEDEHEDMRKAAFETMGKLGSSAATPAILAVVLRMLSDEESDMREAALKAVGSLGASAAIPPILAGILKLLGDENKWVYRATLEAVGKLGSTASMPAFLEGILRGLTDESYDVREAAIKAVGGLEASEVTPAFLDTIQKLLDDKNKDVCQSAIYAVGQLGSSAATPPILTGILRLLGDENLVVRVSALYAVRMLGPSAATPHILTSILKLLGDEHKWVYRAALEAVDKLGSSANMPVFLEGILKGLNDENYYVRETALNVVNKLEKAVLTENYLSALLQQNADKIYCKQLIFFIRAAFHQGISVSIICLKSAKNIESPFKLEVISPKQTLTLPLTVSQAQMLRHLIPEGLKLIQNNHFEKAIKLFEKFCQKKLPSIKRDPLMQDYLSLTKGSNNNLMPNQDRDFPATSLLSRNSVFARKTTPDLDHSEKKDSEASVSAASLP